jgi:hypothetical protein
VEQELFHAPIFRCSAGLPLARPATIRPATLSKDYIARHGAECDAHVDLACTVRTTWTIMP